MPRVRKGNSWDVPGAAQHTVTGAIVVIEVAAIAQPVGGSRGRPTAEWRQAWGHGRKQRISGENEREVHSRKCVWREAWEGGAQEKRERGCPGSGEEAWAPSRGRSHMADGGPSPHDMGGSTH